MMNRPPVTFKDSRTKKKYSNKPKRFFFSFIPPAAQICKDKAQKKKIWSIIKRKKKHEIERKFAK